MDEDERALFRAAMRGVRRLTRDARVYATPPRQPPRARFTRAERHSVLLESLGAACALDPVAESGDALLFRRAGIGEPVLRRLRAGQYRLDGEIDLHGLTAARVEPALREFLAEALRHHARVVRVIHGKGLRSGSRPPVLKQVAAAYLQRVDAVLAFASAREVDGGTGAILVLLAPSRNSRRRRPAGTL